MANISTIPPKGTRDWEPVEFAIRKYIFNTWRSVCHKFGYQEYLTPLVEYADVYRAKSGDEVGGSELTVFEDRGGRELAIRPEMTPSVTRMVSNFYQSVPKPIRLFSIANFFRNQKPQKGRNREFWQLNFDIFGTSSLNADVETLRMSIEIMKAFGSSADQFRVFVNHRKSIEYLVRDYLKVPEENVAKAIQLLDRVMKLPQSEFLNQLGLLGAEILDQEFIYEYLTWDQAAIIDAQNSFLKNDPGYQELQQIFEALEALGLSEYVAFNPGMVRGFDYYDGMVFEVFDLAEYLGEGSARSLFGGGRYNGLAGIFGKDSFPAVGAAPGDETMRLFLEAHNLIPEELTARQGYYLPVLADSAEAQSARQKIVTSLREQGEVVIEGLELEKFGKAIANADKRNAAFVILLGENELEANKYMLKDLVTGEQEEKRL